jgi:hypothetical protein
MTRTAGGPAQLTGAAGEVVLAGCGLGVPLDLGEGGLADVFSELEMIMKSL